MLVLTRKRAESIKIGNDIVIKVIQTNRGTVKLGIDAPAHVRVLRAELTEFATPVVAAAHSATDVDGNAVDTDQSEESDSLADDDCFIEFGSEYAEDVADQLLCLAE